MGVDLVWQHENGKVLEEIPDPKMCIATLAFTLDLSGTVCLRFIDPYGHTIFNQRQIPILIKELEAISPKVTDYDTQIHLIRVLELAERSKGEARTMLKFRGA
jgi:hypothetical protein